MLRALREELRHSESFTFSVAFVSAGAIALLKQELVEYRGEGRIVTSDYLGFNSPAAFEELLNLRRLGIDVRLHRESAFHPKGYLFRHADRMTAIVGSSNLTKTALVKNHEWNLKVSSAHQSDLTGQLGRLIEGQLANSVPLSREWIDDYAESYRPPHRGDVTRVERRTSESRETEPLALRSSDGLSDWNDVFPFAVVDESERRPAIEVSSHVATPEQVEPPRPQALVELSIVPNAMQTDALIAIDEMRRDGKRRAVVISATGTGKTILSALDVRAARPQRMLFVVHREQILDRAIQEFQRVLEAPASDFGKLTGSWRQSDRKYVFATVQTLSQPHVLATFTPSDFDYILIDEVHRAGAASYHRVIDYFEPAFLLGMTATPERTDGFNVFELFDFNVPYEIRLNRALEADMLVPFHYYGVTDVEFDDGSTTDDLTPLHRLASSERVRHIVDALEVYGHVGTPVRGLIFCSRKDEAHALSAELNQSEVHGRRLRTIALTGDDSIERREHVVAQLESGVIDYVLTVDIFNEGVDIPTVNQVVMLRQTQSAIVFVQQLGRGLRKDDGKDYLVVIDFIGNYANNYLIPIALFGDESLNKESVRQHLIAAEEKGVLAGLSSVRFDQIAQERVLKAIAQTQLNSLKNLKAAIEILANRLGQTPTLMDFFRFESADPVVLATRSGSYPALLERLFKVDAGLTLSERKYLTMLSSEVLAAKRPHELLLVRSLMDQGSVTCSGLEVALAEMGVAADANDVNSAVQTLTLAFHTGGETKKYEAPIIERRQDGSLVFHREFASRLELSPPFRVEVEDLVSTGLAFVASRYLPFRPFTPGRQYSRKDACRLLKWPKNVSSTIYGYKVDERSGACPIFVTLHKSDDVPASTAYEDALLNPSTLLWYTRSRRTLQSSEVAAIVENRVAIHVFAKKDDAEGSDFYYLGKARADEPEQTTMAGESGEQLNVVRMLLHFEAPIEAAIFDYFRPIVTASAQNQLD